jgi:hypothetical protein
MLTLHQSFHIITGLCVFDCCCCAVAVVAPRNRFLEHSLPSYVDTSRVSPTFECSDDQFKAASSRARIEPTTCVYYDPYAWRYEQPPVLPEDLLEEERLAAEAKLPILKPLPADHPAAPAAATT